MYCQFMCKYLSNQLLSNALQALAIYKTLSTEPAVSSTESQVETEHAELDSGKESMDTVLYGSEKDKVEDADKQTTT